MSKDKVVMVRYLVTFAAVTAAALVVVNMFQEYFFHPWTRDAHVRAQVIKVTPRVSGPIVDLPVHDNQRELAIEQARAKLKQAQATEIVKADQARRGRDLHKKDKGAISEQSLVRKENDLLVARANVEVAAANLQAAHLDLEFTEVRAPVEGYVTNLLLRDGSQTVANQPALALVDRQSGGCETDDLAGQTAARRRGKHGLGYRTTGWSPGS